MAGVDFPPKKIATRVKHSILENYVSAWGGIIILNNRSRQKAPIHLCYVDTCCGPGTYESNAETPAGTDAIGSPIIALRQMQKLPDFAAKHAVNVELRAMLVNHNDRELEQCRQAISREDLPSTEVVYRHAHFEDIVEDVTNFTEGSFAFVLVDPFGPKAIPMHAVAPLVEQTQNDCLIYFATNRLIMWMGIARKPAASRLPAEESIVQTGTDFFGTKAWIDLARNGQSPEERESSLIALYRRTLSNRDVRTMAIPLLFDDQSKTKYHLVFTSRNIAGLYSMKEEFLKGDQHQYLLRSKAALDRERRTKGGFLFAPPTLDNGPNRPEPDIADVAEHIMGMLESHERMEFKDVLAGCLDMDDVIARHVRRAVTRLRKAGRIDAPLTTELRYGSLISRA